ncbi:MAG: hypothetical protein DRN03_00220 [Thermoplasmata archaeon]|nr:MAG: hypothetical protein DRN03_00220 [Thermoplasmata archaeon]
MTNGFENGNMIAAWIAVGIVIGIIISISAIELSRRKPKKIENAFRCTERWSIDNFRNPKVVAEYLLDASSIPRNAKIVVKKCSDKSNLRGLDIRYNPNVKGSFVVESDRAIILSGPFKENELALITVNKDIVNRLNELFEAYWKEGIKPRDV